MYARHYHIVLECAAIMLCVLYSCSSGIAEATLTLASKRTVHEYLRIHSNNQHVQVRTREDITVLCSPSINHYKMTDEQPEADIVVAVNVVERAALLESLPVPQQQEFLDRLPLSSASVFFRQKVQLCNIRACT
jgi:hypothetical protein